MRVEAAPLITAAPKDIGVTAGNAANFSVTAQGTSLSYAWQRSNDGGATYAPVAGTAARLSLVAALTDNGALFRVKVSNAGGSVTSTPDVFSTTPLILEFRTTSAMRGPRSRRAWAVMIFGCISSRHGVGAAPIDRPCSYQRQR